MERKPEKAFPLRKAYPFADQHGLSEDARKIRDMDITWSRSYTSSVRRGFMIALFKRHGLLAAFKETQWPYGLTKGGQAEETRDIGIKNDFESSPGGVPPEPKADRRPLHGETPTPQTSTTQLLRTVGLEWHRFSKLTDARRAFPKQPCVYVHTDKARNATRVGVATKGLDLRYHGGTGYSMDAAMHGSGNLIFVALVEPELCGAVELELIWQGRNALTYNNVGKRRKPLRHLALVHRGDAPTFTGFEVLI